MACSVSNQFLTLVAVEVKKWKFNFRGLVLPLDHRPTPRQAPPHYPNLAASAADAP